VAEHNTFYKKAYYYDVIFDRDVSREVNFMLDAYRKHSGLEAKSTLDICCGPGYHAREFSRRGLRAVGLDLSKEMIDFGKEKSTVEGTTVEWVVADMRKFSLSQPVDIAFTLFDAIDALLTNSDLVQHLRAVASNLTEKGIYILEITHPRDTSLFDYGKFSYHGKQNGTQVDLIWATNNPKFDLQTCTADVDIELHVKERMLFPQEIILLAESSGMIKVVDWFGDLDIKQPFDSTPKSRRMVVVMQKVSG
jgi:SAM-dependent methyltransferase